MSIPPPYLHGITRNIRASSLYHLISMLLRRSAGVEYVLLRGVARACDVPPDLPVLPRLCQLCHRTAKDLTILTVLLSLTPGYSYVFDPTESQSFGLLL